MKIQIETIDHARHRYGGTVGDWQVSQDGSLYVAVSKLPDPRHEFLIGLHELIECALCAHRRIRQSEVDAFDMMFEAERERGVHSDDAEPGDDPRAPYRREHFFATNIERLMAAELGVDWAAYCEAIEAL